MKSLSVAIVISSLILGGALAYSAERDRGSARMVSKSIEKAADRQASGNAFAACVQAAEGDSFKLNGCGIYAP